MRSREQIVAALSSRREELHELFGLSSLALFGSASRDETHENSDVDVLVEFDRPATLFTLASVEEYLSELLDVQRVDVVLRGSLLPALRESILRDAVDVE